MSEEGIRAKLDDLNKTIAADDPDLTKCSSLLRELKIGLTTLPGLVPGVPTSESGLSDVILARDVYEAAALLSLKHRDEVAFERHVAQAKTLYVDYANVIPVSPRQNLVLGLNLMRLMAQNRIGEFHTEVELIPPSARGDQYIDYALRLEHYLMEGSYSKIREEKVAVPHESFTMFAEDLMETVRREVGKCIGKAYQSLPVEAAMRMMSLESEDLLLAYCEEMGWLVEDGILKFSVKEQKKGGEMIASAEMIERSLTYARELEQII